MIDRIYLLLQLLRRDKGEEGNRWDRLNRDYKGYIERERQAGSGTSAGLIEEWEIKESKT